ncbi:CTP synthase, PyrG [Mycobacteroides abscessus subsp. abscessus]|nr:CTP synthase, PyrG [Mycobacteroides abscessus subsp. abscessus]
MRKDAGSENVLYIHVTLVPYLKAAEELKTKPTQHSVKELRSLGIQPNLLVVRTETELPDSVKTKLANFCDVEKEAIIENQDVTSIYEIPLLLKEQKMDDIILDKLNIQAPQPDMTSWKELVTKTQQLQKTVRIALVGKYVALPDAYLSVVEALKHAGYQMDRKVHIDWINSEEVTAENAADILKDADGILVPGGFGSRGLDGKMFAIQYARENRVPFLGICLGMQLACIEFARNVVGLKDANSTETHPVTQHPIISLMADQDELGDLGGTQRLGLYPCELKEGSLARALYQETSIEERHRHRFEFNNAYREQLAEHGLVFSGLSPDKRLVEVIELKDHPYFIASQYHPEFLSRPDAPHPLFAGLIKAALKG